MQAADAPRVALNPGHRVGAGLHAGADVELQHHGFWRPGCQHLHGALAFHWHELQLVIVIPRLHLGGLQLLRSLGQLLGHGFPAVERGDVAGAGPHQILRAQNLVQLDGFLHAVGRKALAAVVRGPAGYARIVHHFTDFFGALGRPGGIRREELHHGVAHLGHRAHGRRHVFGQLIANRIKFEAHRDVAAGGGCLAQ